MTAPTSTTEALQRLDWKHETPCQHERCRAGHPPARWRYVGWCGCVELVCDPCKDGIENAIAGPHAYVVVPGHCDRCRKGYLGPVSGIGRIEPLP